MKKWTGRWIEYTQCPENATAIFEKEFPLAAAPENAILTVSGLGFYLAEINGVRVTEDLLPPAFTAYDKTVLYNDYEVSSFLNAGLNTIRITLGNGWYHEPGEDCFDFEHAVWKNRLQMICELTVNGSLLVASDSSWHCTSGPTRYNSVRFGEDYDATFVSEPSVGAHLAKGPGGILKRQHMPPIRIERTVPGKLLPGGVYDFGANIAGDTEIFLLGKRGMCAEIIYGERLDGDGNIDQTLIKRHPTISRNQIDHYTLAGCAEGERWHPDFSYKGFRYVQVKGPCAVLEITARVFHTQLAAVGSFTCSEPVMEAIHRAVVNSTLMNYHHIPTDCPHREKNGWTGDAHLSSEQALYNFDMIDCYVQYLDDLADCQWPSGQLPCIAPTSVYGFNYQSGPTWDAALILIPWNLYRFTGDTSYLRRYYPAMKRYLRYAESISENHLCSSGLGDFLPDPSVEACPAPMILTAFVMYLAEITAKIAGLLGYRDDVTEFAVQARLARQAVNVRYLTEMPETESALAVALHFGLSDNPQALADQLVHKVRLRGYHSGGGVFSSVYILDALTEYGYFEDALAVAAQTTFPSWGYMLQDGGNSLWEHWSGKTGSLNHHMRSPIDAWFYRSVAGLCIDDDAPGFRHLLLTPHFSEKIKSFSAAHQSPHGLIRVFLKDNLYTVSLPEGVTATLSLGEQKTELTGTSEHFIGFLLKKK